MMPRRQPALISCSHPMIPISDCRCPKPSANGNTPLTHITLSKTGFVLPGSPRFCIVMRKHLMAPWSDPVNQDAHRAEHAQSTKPRTSGGLPDPVLRFSCLRSRAHTARLGIFRCADDPRPSCEGLGAQSEGARQGAAFLKLRCI